MVQKLELDTETMIGLQEMGLTQKQIANELGCHHLTIANRIAKIQKDQGLLLQYRSLQSLQLTELQQRVLEAITTEKINEAPLRDLVVAFKILKDKELVLEGKPSDIKGLVAYLVELEKEEAALIKPIEGDFEEVEGVVKEITDPDYVPEV